MRNLSILMTGAGSPGFPSFFNCIKHNGERDIRIVGVDMNQKASSRGMADGFYQVPAARDPAFLDRILEICKKENIDVIIPTVTRELEPFAKSKGRFEEIGTKVAVMDLEPLHIANNKGLMMTAVRKAGLPTPEFSIAHNAAELEKLVSEMGYPEKKVVVKPTFGNGSRGVRILDGITPRADRFFKEKPESQIMRLEELMAILKEADEMPEMMVMEYLSGEEISVDILADHGKTLYCSCREGDVVSSIMINITIKENREAIELAKAVTELLGLDGNLSYDMRKDSKGVARIMEINPRLPAGIASAAIAGVNFPYLGVKKLLGEELPDCKVETGYMMQFRKEEVFYKPDGSPVGWK